MTRAHFEARPASPSPQAHYRVLRIGVCRRSGSARAPERADRRLLGGTPRASGLDASSRASRRPSCCTATTPTATARTSRTRRRTTTTFPTDEMLAGTWTLDEYSRRLDELELWPTSRQMEASPTTGAGRSRAPRSTSRCSRPGSRSQTRRASVPAGALRRLDAGEDRPVPRAEPRARVQARRREGLGPRAMERLAATDRVRVLDLKAYYRGTVVDLAPDPELYRAVAERFPDVVIEDAWLEDGCREALAGAEDRLSFDAPIHSWSDVGKLPLEPRWLNIKPSRFGTLAGLLECIEECEERGIRMYGGGQFELGPGRRQIQRLASALLRRRAERRRAVRVQRRARARGLPHEPACRRRTGSASDESLRRLCRRTASAGSARSWARRSGVEPCTSSRPGNASARTTGTSARRSGCSSSRERRRCARRRASRCCARGTSPCS